MLNPTGPDRDRAKHVLLNAFNASRLAVSPDRHFVGFAIRDVIDGLYRILPPDVIAEARDEDEARLARAAARVAPTAIAAE